MLPLLAACGDVMDDLDPSGSDERPPVQAGTTGPAVGQNAPDFTVSDSLGNPLSLSAVLRRPSSRSTTVTASPIFSDERVQPLRSSRFGLASSKPQFTTLPASSLTST
jgi:hypothetical protein